MDPDALFKCSHFVTRREKLVAINTGITQKHQCLKSDCNIMIRKWDVFHFPHSVSSAEKKIKSVTLPGCVVSGRLKDWKTIEAIQPIDIRISLSKMICFFFFFCVVISQLMT